MSILTRADRYLAGGFIVVTLLAAMPFYYSRFVSSRYGLSATRATVKTQGRIVRKLELVDPAQWMSFVVNGRIGPATVVVDGRKICIGQATCPDKICVRRGWISKPGESIVCIPNEIIIFIEGDNPLDGVTR